MPICFLRLSHCMKIQWNPLSDGPIDARINLAVCSGNVAVKTATLDTGSNMKSFDGTCTINICWENR
jgi:hypothetical protein